MDSWKVRDELLLSLNQWYLVIAFILCGALIGFGISYLIPAPYQAVSDIYIGIDVERVNQLEYIIPLAEEEPLNLDDYKNWQLKQVADILTSNNVLNQVLANLHKKGTAYDKFSLQDLRNAVDIYWYDTGTWRMEVVLSEDERAVEVLDTWMDLGHQEISKLLEISKAGSAIDNEIWSYNLAISEIKVQRTKYQAISSSCSEWITVLEEFPGDQQIDSDLYIEIKDWTQTQIDTASFSLDRFFDIPTDDSSVDTYIQWFNEIQSAADNAVIQLEDERMILVADRDERLPVFHKYLTDSLGLSANLVLLPNTSETEVSQIYSTGNFTIGGSVLGLSAWIIFVAVKIGSRKENHGK